MGEYKFPENLLLQAEDGVMAKVVSRRFLIAKFRV
jgi:hypothetical protein